MAALEKCKSRWSAVVFSIAAFGVLTMIREDAMAADGLTTIKSTSSPKETMERLQAAVVAKGMTVFAHIDHGAGAAAVGLPLRPTDLLIFGSAKGGTPLMQSVQTAGVDLPLKVLVWQDETGTTWLSYNSPKWIAERHEAGSAIAPTVRALDKALDEIAASAASKSSSN